MKRVRHVGVVLTLIGVLAMVWLVSWLQTGTLGNVNARRSAINLQRLVSSERSIVVISAQRLDDSESTQAVEREYMPGSAEHESALRLLGSTKWRVLTPLKSSAEMEALKLEESRTQDKFGWLPVDVPSDEWVIIEQANDDGRFRFQVSKRHRFVTVVRPDGSVFVLSGSYQLPGVLAE